MEELTGYKELDEFLREVCGTMKSKGHDYREGHDDDLLHNFRTVGDDTGISMEKVWYVYTSKHWKALKTYIKEGGQSESEPIEGRIKDLIVYLLLFRYMVGERKRLAGDPTHAQKKNQNDKVSIPIMDVGATVRTGELVPAGNVELEHERMLILAGLKDPPKSPSLDEMVEDLMPELDKLARDGAAINEILDRRDRELSDAVKPPPGPGAETRGSYLDIPYTFKDGDRHPPEPIVWSAGPRGIEEPLSEEYKPAEKLESLASPVSEAQAKEMRDAIYGPPSVDSDEGKR